MSIPAVLIGGLLWNINPKLPFLVALTIDGAIRLPILIYKIPETLIVYGHHYPTGPHIILYGLSGSGKTTIAHLVQKELSLEIIDENAFKDEKQNEGSILSSFTNNDLQEINNKLNIILNKSDRAIVIEGKLAIFAAKDKSKGLVILLVAPKYERVRRESRERNEPDFVVLKKVEEEDRKIAKLTRRLFGVDISKLPPFDIAINTESIPLEKILEIIKLLYSEEKRENGDKQQSK